MNAHQQSEFVGVAETAAEIAWRQAYLDEMNTERSILAGRGTGAALPSPGVPPHHSTPRPHIVVLGGVNGAGKSSVLGQMIVARGGLFYDPDAHAQKLVEAAPAGAMTLAAAQGLAWQTGYAMLKQAVAEGRYFALETTLGGREITDTLIAAHHAGAHIELRYIGLTSAEEHIARVHARVARGGHDIPEANIRERWATSPANACRLAALAQEVRVFSNAIPVDRDKGELPVLNALLHWSGGRLRGDEQVRDPDWVARLAAVLQGRTSG